MNTSEQVFKALKEYNSENSFRDFSEKDVKNVFENYDGVLLDDLIILEKEGKISIDFIRGGIGSKIQGPDMKTLKLL